MAIAVLAVSCNNKKEAEKKENPLRNKLDAISRQIDSSSKEFDRRMEDIKKRASQLNHADSLRNAQKEEIEKNK